jgi:histone arginine demethylase JMJD6
MCLYARAGRQFGGVCVKVRDSPCAFVCTFLHLQDISLEEFVSKYETPRVPVVLTGLTDGWAAQQEWTPRKLLEQYREHRFKVGVCGGGGH